MWNLRSKINEQRKKETDKETLNYGEQTGDYQRGGGWRMGEISDGDQGEHLS